jgi:hypothetical protein
MRSSVAHGYGLPAWGIAAGDGAPMTLAALGLTIVAGVRHGHALLGWGRCQRNRVPPVAAAVTADSRPVTDATAGGVHPAPSKHFQVRAAEPRPPIAGARSQADLVHPRSWMRGLPYRIPEMMSSRKWSSVTSSLELIEASGRAARTRGSTSLRRSWPEADGPALTSRGVAEFGRV